MADITDVGTSRRRTFWIIGLLASATLLLAAAPASNKYEDWRSRSSHTINQCALPLSDRTGGWTC
ncbi:hypothetical protein SAMN05892883_0644 [Jatrophihabitans sp. GAS493]|nr:hypothetical protein SAMN05892883_0644 [Jatrophihabitans sp. GAS493]